MATETTKYAAQSDGEARHSALEELYRDERRPALLLLSGLVIAVIFFALGVMVGRWISDDTTPKVSPPATPTTRAVSDTPTSTRPAATNQPSQTIQPSASPVASANSATDAGRSFTLLIATYNTPEDAQPLIKKLEQAGYKDVRTSTPRKSDRQPKFSVLLGRFTRDEADQLAARMRATGDPRLRNVRVIQEPSN